MGEEWYVYDRGIWEMTERDIFSMEAMESMHPDHREASRVCDLLDHVQCMTQVPRKLFLGAYKRADEHILINANNHVLDVLPDGTVVPLDHSADYHFTLKLPTDYDPSARCPEFEATLEYALPDEADRNLLRVFAGYTLYPGCEFQKALVCFGDGGNGKSTLLEGVGHVFGEFLCSAAGLCGSRSQWYSHPCERGGPAAYGYRHCLPAGVGNDPRPTHPVYWIVFGPILVTSASKRGCHATVPVRMQFQIAIM